MPAKRKSTGKRLRFEIFARDGFQCRYCGRQSDEVKLVLDHIEPVALGGLTVPENLVTACEPCNQGKAAKRIPVTAPTEDDRLRREQELREQEDSLRIVKRMVQARENTRLALKECLLSVFGDDRLNTPTMAVLESYIREHGPALVFEWIEKAGRVTGLYSAGRYVSGIRRSWKKQQEEAAL